MNIRFLFSKTYDFLMKLDDFSVSKISKSLGLLESYGHTIEYPHTKSVGRGVFELRVLSCQHIRIFFVYKHNEAVVLHAIIKKSQKIPKKELDYVYTLKSKLH